MSELDSVRGSLLAPSLIGIYSRNQGEDLGSELRKMSAGLNTSIPLRSHTRGRCACAASDKIARMSDNGLIAITGHPRWTQADLATIANNNGHASALITAYEQYGVECLKHLEGAFSCIIIDPDKEQVIAGTDRLGQYPIFYAQTDNGIAIGSSAGSILGCSQVTHTLQEQGIYDYVYFHMVPSPVTIFKHVRKLPASHYVIYKNGRVSVDHYWLPEFQEQNTRSISSLSLELKERLTQSVSDAVSDYTTTGTFLSGGLDSSTVTGILSEISDQQVRAYSIGFSAEGYDEMAYARITAKHFGVDLHEYYVTPEDVVKALPIIATSYDEPFGNSSALPAYFCAKLAADDGITRLLAGDGGDELFAGNERYAKQKVFETYKSVPAPLRHYLLEPLIGALPESVRLVGKAQSYINQANVPLPDRLQTYNFLHRHQPAEIFSSEFLSEINTASPIALQSETYNRPLDASVQNRMLYLDWQYTLADNDIRKVSHMCALAGIEVTYPMLDDRLLQFSTTIPSVLKLKGKNLRYFYKTALTNWLPKETISKRKQGFGLPFGVWMQTHKPLQDLAYNSLLSLKKSHYFNSKFIDEAIELHRSGHAAYYGELIWILTVLHLWMDQHN